MADRSALYRFIPPVSTQHSVAWRYGAAVLTSLAVIGLYWLLGQFIGYDTPFAILFIPIALSAFYGGLGPGLVSTLICVALADYLLIPPLYTLGLPDAKSVVTTILFAVSGMVTCVMGELGRSAMLRATHEAEIRKVAQNQLQITEEHLRIAEQVVAGGVWEWDVPAGTVFWSDGYRRLCDYPMNEQPTQEKWLKSIHPDDRERVSGMLDELFRKNLHNWSAEYRIVTASNRTRWISSHARLFCDSLGQPKRMVGINLDVTARHRAAEVARNNETKMRLLMQHGRVGDFEWNPRDGSMQCSPAFYEMAGLNPAVPPTFDALIKLIHPDDRARIHSVLTDLQENPGQDFDFENRVVGSDGTVRLVHARGAAIRDESDGTVRVVGIAIELSRRGKEVLAS